MYDIAVIGAGITGVAVSHALARKSGSWRIVVLEKEAGVARHTSGRNSGVVHPGFNPKPGTLKARLCVEGNRLLQDFCRNKGLPLRPVGVTVIARSEAEIETLAKLYRHGCDNGVPGIALLDGRQLERIEPNVGGVAALHAPTGAVVDNRAVVEALAEEAAERGVEFKFDSAVVAVEDKGSTYRVHTRAGEALSCRYLINCGGLHADRIAHAMGVGRDYAILPFRGEYFVVVDEKAGIVRSAVYPVPPLGYPFLGIHFTPTVAGELLVGPNVVLAPGREAYMNRQISARDAWAMSRDARTWRLFSSAAFRRFAWRHLRTSVSRNAFAREVATLVRGLDVGDLRRGHAPGIRAQLVDGEGRLVDDMLVETSGRSLHVLNAVSPGFTCALPFSEYIANLV